MDKDIENNADSILRYTDLTAERLQREKLSQLRKQRDNEKVDESLKKLGKAAEGEENLMPFILEAVKTYATLGEICDVLREVFGEYEQSVIL